MIFLFKAILCILINNENSSGKRFVFFEPGHFAVQA